MHKYQILLLNNISSHGLSRLPEERSAAGKHAEHPDAILVRSHDMQAMSWNLRRERSTIWRPACWRGL